MSRPVLTGLTFKSVSRFKAAYTSSRLVLCGPVPKLPEMSGSNLSRAYSWREESHSGVSVAR